MIPELLKCGAAKWCVFASKMQIVPNRIRESAVVRKSRGSPSVFGTSLRTGTRNKTPGLYKVWTRQTKLSTRHTRSVAWWMNIGQRPAPASFRLLTHRARRCAWHELCVARAHALHAHRRACLANRGSLCKAGFLLEKSAGSTGIAWGGLRCHFKSSRGNK